MDRCSKHGVFLHRCYEEGRQSDRKDTSMRPTSACEGPRLLSSTSSDPSACCTLGRFSMHMTDVPFPGEAQVL